MSVINKRIKLFKVAEGAAMVEDESPKAAQVAEDKDKELASLAAEVEKMSLNYKDDVFDAFAKAVADIEAMKPLINTDPGQVLDKISTLLGVSTPTTPPTPPAPTTTDTAPPTEPTSGPVSGPPTAKDKKTVDKATDAISEEAGKLTEILKSPEAAGGGKKMESKMSMGDIIKMAISKSAQDPPLGAMPPAPPAPGAPPAGGAVPPIPTPGAPTPPASQAFVDMKRVEEILGDPTSAKPDPNSAIGIVDRVLNLISSLIDTGLDNKGLGKQEDSGPVQGIRLATDNIRKNTVVIRKSIADAVSALKSMCNTIASNDISEDAKSLKARIEGLDKYLSTEWTDPSETKEKGSAPKDSEG